MRRDCVRTFRVLIGSGLCYQRTINARGACARGTVCVLCISRNLDAAHKPAKIGATRFCRAGQSSDFRYRNRGFDTAEDAWTGDWRRRDGQRGQEVERSVVGRDSRNALT
jgi:hypothetical protein